MTATAALGHVEGYGGVQPSPRCVTISCVDFGRAYDEVGAFLSTAGFHCAVVGGVALAAYGCPRMTLDLDLATEAEAQGELVGFLESRGYSTLHRSSGYSNHLHADRSLGRVDVVYVQGDSAARLFGGVRTLTGPGGRPIAVPRPEHLIAMKVHAMRNAPDRTWQELVDIAYLLRLDGVNRDEVKRYFERADLLERWHALERGF